MKPLVVASGVSFGYHDDQPVLRKLDCQVEAGRCLALLGSNGAGKTTLMRLLAGLLRPTTGEVHIDGTSIQKLAADAKSRLIGMLPQRGPKANGYAVYEVVLMGLYSTMPSRGWESVREWRAVAEALNHLGVGDLKRRPFEELSGGEQRRVLLARALVSKPRLLLLDEPLASLDPGFGLELISTLQQLKRDGTGIIVATHHLGLADELSDNALLLRRGEVVASGLTNAVLTTETLNAAYGTTMFSHHRLTGWSAAIPWAAGLRHA